MQPDIISQLLILALKDRVDNGHGPLVVSKSLLEQPLPVYVVFDDQTTPGVASVSLRSSEVLRATVDNDVVEVIV